MMISKEKYNKINNLLLVLILGTIFFRPVSTGLIFLFAGFNLVNFKYLNFDRKLLPYFLILAIPILLEFLFVWNNIESNKTFKPIEKVLSFIIFPLFITFNYEEYNFLRIADCYRKLGTILIIVLLIRFLIISPEYVEKYIHGIHLWEMGYVITNSFGNHAPAVNMQIAFVVVLNLYFLLNDSRRTFLLNILFLISSSIALFIINTRLSLGSCIICCLLIVVSIYYKRYKIKSLYFIGIFALITTIVLGIAFYSNPYMKEKYSKVTFSNMDKIGKLDEIENPDGVLHNALVTRITIWKTAIELGKEKLLTGYGSANGKDELNNYYKKTNQKFLAKYQFPVHNQIIDYFLKFGILGSLSLLFYFIYIFRISIVSKNILGLCFVTNFLLSNLFDDFLIRFDGIVFSAIWFSLIISTCISVIKKRTC